jgi:hypothetical protein
MVGVPIDELAVSYGGVRLLHNLSLVLESGFVS